MEAFISDVFNFLLQYYALYLVIFMGIITTLIVTILKFAKIPFKKLTLKITNITKRRIVNRTVIFVASFGLSFLFWFLLNLIVPQYFTIDYLQIFCNGALPIVVYAYAEGWIDAKKAKSLVETVVDKISDGELTNEEVKETVKEVNTAIDPEKELKKLLKK